MSSRKAGDWDCPHCDHLNFSRRDSCQRCGEPRPLMQERPREVEFSNSSSSSGRTVSYGFNPAGRSFHTEDVRPGDWYCLECNAHNFASRTGCYKCGAFRDQEADVIDRGFDSMRRESSSSSRMYGAGVAAPSYGGGFSRSSWKSGDWICPRTGCKEHNFANRIECFRCNARREPGM